MKLNANNIIIITLYISVMSLFLIIAAGVATGFSQDIIKQSLPTLDASDVQLIENRSYCSTGFGTQVVAFKLDDKEVHSEKSSNTYSPSLMIYDSPFISVGCTFNKIFVDYGYFYNAIKFNETVEYDNSTCNTIEFKLNSISLGYSFTLIDHYLHVDAGIGYSQIQYELGFDGSLSKEGLNDSGPFYLVNIKLFLTAYLYVNWYNQQAMESESVVTYANKLGLNFLVKL